MKCTHCGKPLTDPTSMRRGIGPDCWKKRLQSDRTRTGNLFGSAEFTWNVDGGFIWLKDHGTDCRSLTNDMENALVYIQAKLQNPITNYTIIYRDSEGIWDGVRITRFDANAVKVDYQWLSDGRYPHYWSQGLDVDFFWIGEKNYEAAKAKVISEALAAR